MVNNPVKVIVVDDHPIARHGIIQLIDQDENIQTCAEAESAGEAISLIKEIKPDLALIDISLKGANGIELIKSIRLIDKNLKILVVSMHDESLYAERALRAGAQGYIMKQEAVENILTALKEILGGKIYLSENISSDILQKIVGGPAGRGETDVDVLTDRELEVFQLIGQGIGTRQIAKQLSLSVKTIETHRENIKGKLKISNATELVQYAVKWHAERT